MQSFSLYRLARLTPWSTVDSMTAGIFCRWICSILVHDKPGDIPECERPGDCCPRAWSLWPNGGSAPCQGNTPAIPGTVLFVITTLTISIVYVVVSQLWFLPWCADCQFNECFSFFSPLYANQMVFIPYIVWLPDCFWSMIVTYELCYNL